MSSLQEPVAGEQGFVPCSGTKYRSIVAYPYANFSCGSVSSAQSPAGFLDQLSLAHSRDLTKGDSWLFSLSVTV